MVDTRIFRYRRLCDERLSEIGINNKKTLLNGSKTYIKSI
jgi:hypothetical protein